MRHARRHRHLTCMHCGRCKHGAVARLLNRSGLAHSREASKLRRMVSGGAESCISQLRPRGLIRYQMPAHGSGTNTNKGGQTENLRFDLDGLGGSGRPGNPSTRWGLRPPFFGVSPGCSHRPVTPKFRNCLSYSYSVPHLVSPMCRHMRVA